MCLKGLEGSFQVVRGFRDFACVHACMHSCVHACVRACVHACMHACTRVYVLNCLVTACVRMYGAHTCVRTCVRAYTRVCVHALVCVMGAESANACMRAPPRVQMYGGCASKQSHHHNLEWLAYPVS